jgi:hypothetical protein
MEVLVKSQSLKPYVRPLLEKRDRLSRVSAVLAITLVKPDA